MDERLYRRDFLAALGAGSATALLPGALGGAPPPKKRNIKLGIDHFSVRSFGWKAQRYIEYAASLKVDTLLISDLSVFESLEDDRLREIGGLAREKGIDLQVGTGSICPTSRTYDAKRWGPAEEHLKLLIRTAKALGSPVARCYLGNGGDRQGEGGIERHIEAAVKVCRSARSQAFDAGVKIAIENHAGDMQAFELAGLIDAAGKDYVGATMDSGNAVWILEDPMVNLEILGPYAVTTGMRDSVIWETPGGASAIWANMGQGVVDWQAYLDRFQALCPGVPFVLEILSYVWPREIPYLDPKMWSAFPKARASEFARFVALARRGKEYRAPEGRPKGEKSRELEEAQQKYDLEESLKYCRETLGLGMRG